MVITRISRAQNHDSSKYFKKILKFLIENGTQYWFTYNMCLFNSINVKLETQDATIFMQHF